MWGNVTLSSPGSGAAVAIDTSQSATASITVRDIVIDSAVARFPSQQIINYHNEAVLTTTDNLQLSEAWQKAEKSVLKFLIRLKNPWIISLKFLEQN